MTLSRRDFLRVGVAAGVTVTVASCGLFDDGPDRIAYGSAGSQFGDLYVPSVAVAGDGMGLKQHAKHVVPIQIHS